MTANINSDTIKVMSETIVIAGAGFGGVRVALDLSRKLPHQRICLINNSPNHCYTPDLYEVASAKIKATASAKLHQTVSIPLNQIFHASNVEVFIEEIQSIDLIAKKLQTNKQQFEYDYLVLGLGSVTNFFGVEGASQYSHPLKNSEEAVNIRNSLVELSRAKPNLNVVVAGGGFSGVELAGEMNHFLPKQAKVTLIEAMDNILTGMPEWCQKQAAARLQKLGVAVMTKHPIEKISEKELICGGEKVEFDYLIWTAGIKGNNLDQKIKGVEFTKRGQLSVTSNLNLSDHPQVYALGDLAEVIDQKTQKSVPPTAWAAIGEGAIVAKNIIATLNKTSPQSYIAPYPSFVVPVGGKYAMTNALGLEMSGIIIWMIKQMISMRYFLTILPISGAISVWWNGVSTFISNDA